MLRRHHVGGERRNEARADAVGNVLEMADTSGETSYEYDPLYRLDQVTYPNSDSTSYSYDPQGNRVSMTVSGTSVTDYEYDDSDQMLEAGAVTYAYDGNGNRTEAGSDTYAWDHANRLLGTTIDSVEVSYTYTGTGLRASRAVGMQSVSFVWDQNSALPIVLADSDGNQYVYGLDLLARINGSDEEWYLSDGLGSTVQLADADGDVTDSWTYDVFGAVRARTGTSDNSFTFTGEHNDPDGLAYLRARYYEPDTGRFLSRDPLPLLQRYAYVGNNPATMVDPTGLLGQSLFSQTLGYTVEVILDSVCWLRGGCKDLIEWQRKMLLWAKRFQAGVVACAESTVCRTAAVSVGVVGCTAATGGWGTMVCAAAGGAILAHDDVVNCAHGSGGACANAGAQIGISVAASTVGGHAVRGLIRPREISVGTGRNWRFAPFGNKYSRFPHYLEIRTTRLDRLKYTVLFGTVSGWAGR